MSATQFSWLGDISLLLAAAREGSATQAAAQVGISTATAIRRLSAMEQALGVRLFDRMPSGLVATQALSLALPWAEQIEASAYGLIRELEGVESKPSGDVRVSVLEVVSTWFVMPKLPALLKRYPDLRVSLIPEARVVDLVKREADIALRTFRPTTGDLVSKQIATSTLVVAASPSLLAEIKPKSLQDLPWIDWDSSAAQTPDVVWLRNAVPGARVVLRSNGVATQLHAAKAGVGAAVIPEPLLREVGGLVKVDLVTPPLPVGALHMVTHRALRSIPRVAVVWEFITEVFEDLAARHELQQIVDT